MKALRRQIYIWKRYFKIFFTEIDWTADDWREQADHLWEYRRTFIASPKNRNALKKALEINDSHRKQLWESMKANIESGRIQFPTLHDVRYAPYTRTGRLRGSWTYGNSGFTPPV